jgi:nicotinate-nucleotide pyrophosphorylase (carboxylating)
MADNVSLPSGVDSLISLALEEDLAQRGDVTSQFFIPKDHQSKALIITREPAVVAGTGTAGAVFHKVDPELEIRVLHADGLAINPGDGLMAVTGSTRSILTAERTVLNFLQRLTGIATITRRYVDAVKGTNTQVLDTRKTTPGWRALEKAAVLAGGGSNHRMGLFDAMMVKDNHLVADGGADDIAAAVKAARGQYPDICIELEVDTLDQLETYLQIPGIDVILLDNMNPELLAQAVAMRDERAPGVKLEASGGINLDTIASVAASGVDFVSVGALTHSVRAIDLSLDLQTNA